MRSNQENQGEVDDAFNKFKRPGYHGSTDGVDGRVGGGRVSVSSHDPQDDEAPPSSPDSDAGTVAYLIFAVWTFHCCFPIETPCYSNL